MKVSEVKALFLSEFAPMGMSMVICAIPGIVSFKTYSKAAKSTTRFMSAAMRLTSDTR